MQNDLTVLEHPFSDVLPISAPKRTRAWRTLLGLDGIEAKQSQSSQISLPIHLLLDLPTSAVDILLLHQDVASACDPEVLVDHVDGFVIHGQNCRDSSDRYSSKCATKDGSLMSK